MNRIVLIGNGFDLAHGLPTSYKSFIDDFWNNIISNAREYRNNYEDDYIKISANIHLSEIIRYSSSYTFREFKTQIQNFKNSEFGRKSKVTLEVKNRFLKRISSRVNIQNWVDIENEYYQNLKEINNNSIVPSLDNYDIKELNREFEIIERLLEKYLTQIENTQIANLAANQNIRKNIFTPFRVSDLSLSSIRSFAESITNKAGEIFLYGQKSNHHLFDTQKQRYKDLALDYSDTKDFALEIEEMHEKSHLDTNDLIINQLNRGIIPTYYSIPNETLFLNFNYTHTINKYIDSSSYFETIHIHGELNKKDNQMIFGYGDELEESYEKIENLNDNHYLKNVKSIQYLETNNYRKLLSFVESEPYQIVIVGHSCGNSDRTLLNTLFEHENCVSIKPFYHQINKQEDNYSDIIRNISRNFKSKSLMRERVVNKMYCEPLI